MQLKKENTSTGVETGRGGRHLHALPKSVNVILFSRTNEGQSLNVEWMLLETRPHRTVSDTVFDLHMKEHHARS